MKRNCSASLRPFGQTTISSFLAKPKALDDGKQLKSLSPSISKTSGAADSTKFSRTIKVKESAFSSIGSTRNSPNDGKKEENSNSVLSEAVFKQFNSSATDEDISVAVDKDEDRNKSESQESEVETCFDSGKRKNPFGDGIDNCASRLLVLGGDAKPKPKQKKRKKLTPKYNREKPFYDHYANGRGSWDGDMEGVDYEEVGFDAEVWEGMGSTMLGGLDWN